MRFLREGFTIREKAESDLVSEADVTAEKIILEMISDRFPGHAVLAEESQSEALRDSVPEHLWIVDPLDGTTNFAHGIPHFAVSIAYYRDGEPNCGMIWNPAREDRYVALRGQGAWYNGGRLHVGTQTALRDCLIGVGFYYDRGEMMEATLASIHQLFKTGIQGIRRFGTASLDLAQVAQGRYAAFFEYQLSPWDFAAGQLLVEEAGGKVTTTRNAPLPFTQTTVLASNGRLHETVLNIVRR